jgi:hypothetical protein
METKAKSAIMVEAGKKAWRTRRKNQEKLGKSHGTKYLERKNKFIIKLDDGEQIVLPSNCLQLNCGKSVLWKLS